MDKELPAEPLMDTETDEIPSYQFTNELFILTRRTFRDAVSPAPAADGTHFPGAVPAKVCHPLQHPRFAGYRCRPCCQG